MFATWNQSQGRVSGRLDKERVTADQMSIQSKSEFHRHGDDKVLTEGGDSVAGAVISVPRLTGTAAADTLKNLHYVRCSLALRMSKRFRG